MPDTLIDRPSGIEITLVEVPTNYLLSHDALSLHPSRGSNADAFVRDLGEAVLNRYGQTSVAYQKGVLCGQHRDGDVLYRVGKRYYGHSHFAVIEVPKIWPRTPVAPDEVKRVLSGARGELK